MSITTFWTMTKALHRPWLHDAEKFRLLRQAKMELKRRTDYSFPALFTQGGKLYEN